MSELNPYQQFTEEPDRNPEETEARPVPDRDVVPTPERAQRLSLAASMVQDGEEKTRQRAAALADSRKLQHENSRKDEARTKADRNPYWQFSAKRPLERFTKDRDAWSPLVGDEFLKLSPEQKKSELDSLIKSNTTALSDWEARLKKQSEQDATYRNASGGKQHPWMRSNIRTATDRISQLKKELVFYRMVQSGKIEGLDYSAWRNAMNKVPEAFVNTLVSGTLKFAGVVQAAVGSDKKADETAVFEWGKHVESFMKESFPDDPARQFHFTNKLMQGAGSMAAFMGVGFLGAVARLGTKGQLALISVNGGSLEGSSQYEEAKRTLIQAAKDYEKETGSKLKFTQAEAKAMRAAGWGFLLGLSESASFARALGPGGGPLTKGVNQAFEESIQEGPIMTTGSNLIAQQHYDPNRKLNEGVGEAMAIGGILGGKTGILFGFTNSEGKEIQEARLRSGQRFVLDVEPTGDPKKADRENVDIEERKRVEDEKRRVEAETATAVESDTRDPSEPTQPEPETPQAADVARVEISEEDRIDLEKTAEIVGLKEPGATRDEAIARLAEERQKGASLGEEIDPILDKIIAASRNRVEQQDEKATLPETPQSADVRKVDIKEADRKDIDKAAELVGLKKPGDSTDQSIARLAEERQKGASIDPEVDKVLDEVVEKTQTRVNRQNENKVLPEDPQPADVAKVNIKEADRRDLDKAAELAGLKKRGDTSDKSIATLATERSKGATIDPEIDRVLDKVVGVAKGRVDRQNKAKPKPKPKVAQVVNERGLAEVKSYLDILEFVKEGKGTKRPQTLTEFVRDEGGISDAAADLENSNVDENLAPFVKKIAQPGGRSIDEMALNAHQAGFFESRPSVAEFLEAIDEDTRTQSWVRQGDIETLEDFEIREQMRTDLEEVGIRENMTNAQASEAAWAAIRDEFKIREHEEAAGRSARNRETAQRLREQGAVDKLAEYLGNGGQLGWHKLDEIAKSIGVDSDQVQHVLDQGVKDGMLREHNGDYFRARTRPQPALNGAQSVEIRKDIEKRVEEGEIVEINPAAVAQSHLAMRKIGIADDIEAGALAYLQKFEDNGKTLYRGLFETVDGRFFAINVSDLKDLTGLRAGAVIGQRRLVTARLHPIATPIPTIEGEIRHELVHVVFGQIDSGVRDRLLAHAEALGVMDMKFGDFLQIIGDPQADIKDFDNSRTLRSLYQERFNESRDPSIHDAKMAEEALAHMVELTVHGHFTVEQMAPIADDLRAIGEAPGAIDPDDALELAIAGNVRSDTISEAIWENRVAEDAASQDQMMAALGRPSDWLPAFNLRDRNRAPNAVRSLSVILRDLSQAVGVPIRQGRGIRRLFGYNVRTGVSRQQTYYNIHEFSGNLAEALNARQQGEISSIILANQQELGPLGIDDNAEIGFANFVRLYITNPTMARQLAPVTYMQFEGVLDATMPDTLANMQLAQSEIERWNQLEPEAQIESMIVPANRNRPLVERMTELDPAGLLQTLRLRISQYYTNVWDRMHPFWLANRELLRLYQENTGQKLNLTVNENAEKIIRMGRMSHAWAGQDLQEGVRNRFTNEHTGPSLVEALRVALGDVRSEAIDQRQGSRYRRFQSYLVARRARALWDQYQRGERDRPPVSQYAGPVQVQEAIDRLEQRFPSFIQGAELIYQYQNQLLELQMDAGLISEDTYRELLTHVDYVPFMRSFDEDYEQQTNTLGKGVSGIIKRFRGSNRDIVDPLASIAQKTYETRQMIAINDSKRALLELAERAGPAGGAIAERIDATRLEGMRVNVIEALRSAARDLDVDPQDTTALVGLAQQIMGNEAVATQWRNVPIRPGQKPIVWVFENGEPVAMELSHQWLGVTLYQTLQNFGEEHTSLLIKMLAYPSDFIRGTVTSHPEFIGANIVRDGPLSFMYDARMVPLYTQLKGFARAAFGKDEGVQRYAANMGLLGGVQASALDPVRLDRDMEALIEQGYNPVLWREPGEFFDKLFTEWMGYRTTTGQIMAGSAIGAGMFLGGLTGAGIAAVGAALATKGGQRAIAKFTEASETGTRVELMESGIRRARAHGLNDVEATAEGAYHALDYMDYTRGGAAIEDWLRIVAFFRPAMVGIDRYWRSLAAKGDQGSAWTALIKYRMLGDQSEALTPREQQELERSVRTLYTTTLLLGSFSMLVWAINRATDDDEELNDAVREMRAKHWVVSLNGLTHVIPKTWGGDMFEDKSLRIPKPFEAAWFANLVEATMNDMAKNDPRWAEHYVMSLWEIFHPPMEPAAASLGYGLATGVDTHFGTEITPFFDRNSRQENLYGPYTSEFAKDLGPRIGMAPYYVDWAIKGLATSWGRDALNLNVEGTPWYDPKKAEKGIDEYIAARRFLWKKGKGSEAKSTFYDIMSGDDPITSIRGRLFTPYSKLAGSSKDFRDMMKAQDPASAMDMLKTFTDRERGYAILEHVSKGRGAAQYRMLDPMNRANKVLREVNLAMKHIQENRFGVGKTRTHLGDLVDLSPREKRAARDILSQFQMMTAHNALVATKEFGWAQKKEMNTAVVMAELKAVVPVVHKELKRRLDKARILPFAKVRDLWPETKQLIEGSVTQGHMAAGREEIIRGQLSALHARAR